MQIYYIWNNGTEGFNWCKEDIGGTDTICVETLQQAFLDIQEDMLDCSSSPVVIIYR